MPMYALAFLATLLGLIGCGGRVLWSGEPAAGRSAWTTEHMVEASRARAVTVDGRSAWAFTVVDGDDFADEGERAEFGQEERTAFPYVFRDGDEAWIGFSVWFPSDFPSDGDWTIYNQLKTYGVVSPDWQTGIQLGDLSFSSAITGQSVVHWQTAATRRVWHNFVLRLAWDKSDAGRVELYHSTGTATPQQVYAETRQTMHADVTHGVFRQGIYRDPASQATSTMYSAGYRVGTSFDAVNPVSGVDDPDED